MVTNASNPPARLFNGGKASELFFMRLRASRIVVVEVSATAPNRFGACWRALARGGGVSVVGSDRRLRRMRLDSPCIRAMLCNQTEGAPRISDGSYEGIEDPCRYHPPSSTIFMQVTCWRLSLGQSINKSIYTQPYQCLHRTKKLSWLIIVIMRRRQREVYCEWQSGIAYFSFCPLDPTKFDNCVAKNNRAVLIGCARFDLSIRISVALSRFRKVADTKQSSFERRWSCNRVDSPSHWTEGLEQVIQVTLALPHRQWQAWICTQPIGKCTCIIAKHPICNLPSWQDLALMWYIDPGCDHRVPFLGHTRYNTISSPSSQSPICTFFDAAR